MRRLPPQVGETYGRLTILAAEGPRRRCECACGRVVVVAACNLRTGSTRSCGCLQKELVRLRTLTHGHAVGGRVSPALNTYYKMLARCLDPKEAGYKNYGGRGITVCDRWRSSFEAWAADVGVRPSRRHTLDRIDNDGNYEPGNVRWATRAQQNNNRRRTVLVVIDGVSRPLSEWADLRGLKQATVRRRLASGWDPREAVSRPVPPKGGR